MNITCFDIESCSQENLITPPFNREAVLVGNRKEATAEAYRDEQEAKYKADYIKNAALSPESGEVVVWGMLSEKLYYAHQEPHVSEEKIIETAWFDIAQDLRAGNRVCGFNIFAFDLPFLIKRSWMLKVPIPPDIRYTYKGKRYWNENFVDLRMEWTFGERNGPGTLNHIARAFGLEAEDFDFQQLPKDRAKAIELLTEKNLRDLKLTAQIAGRMGL